MSIAENRAEKLASILTADTNRAQELLKLSPEEAVAKINADGNDFTVDEIKDFGDQLKAYASVANENGELSEDALDKVAGGIVISAAVLGAGVTLFLGGVTFGYGVARDRGW